MTVHIGDTVKRKPLTIPKSIDAVAGKAVMEGAVVYVHPSGRFHVVEFPIAGGGISIGLTTGISAQERRSLRESFFGVETEHEKC